MPYVKQAAEMTRGVAMPVAFLPMIPRDLCLSHGIQFEYDECEGQGLGEAELAALETHSGSPYILLRYPQAPRPNYTAILVNERLDDVTDILNEILGDLEFRSEDVLSFDLERYRFVPYRLIREDDHGNRVDVGTYTCLPDALFEQRRLERGGHKQFYQIEKQN